jgi:UDP-N-acetylmuramoylalanine--D-glutamate ligase
MQVRMIQDWRDKRVTVMGLGGFGGGVGVTRWLAQAGARVTVTDKASAEQLRASLEQIDGCGVTLRLGGHDERDFRETDLVVVNPAVPASSDYLRAARDADVAITTEINLFVERCPARTIGITGSVGKSTVTAMVGHVLEQTRVMPGNSPSHGRVWVGGNIGRSLLDGLGQITSADIVVLELSSFQLERTPLVAWSPNVALITNITPNHLDWHGNFAAYTAAKLNIVRFQQPGRDVCVIQNTPDLCRIFDQLYGDLAGVWRYGLEGDVPVAVQQSTSAVDCDDQRRRWEALRLQVPGRHNRENAAAALTAASVLGIPPENACAALATFAALPHRLQRVAERSGVSYYDDSKSTTPESALTALQAFEQPVLVILGGYDKGSDLQAVAMAAARRAKFVACIGKTGPGLAEAVGDAGGAAEFCETLPRAVAACRARAQAGDVVLLSPACASWDQFVDYRARGRMFADLARGDL